jgi:ATP-dependent protease ClpP protease subunit
MDEQVRNLLNEYNTIIMPEDLGHDTYAMMVEAMLILNGRPLTLYCHGPGGPSQDAMGIISLIQHHGNVTGILAGESYSSHAIIFASCAERFVYPGSQIGIHMVGLTGLDTRVDAKYAELIAQDYANTDLRNALILSNASNKSPDYWYEQIRITSGTGIRFDYSTILELELAQPIGERPLRAERESEIPRSLMRQWAGTAIPMQSQCKLSPVRKDEGS